MMGNLYKASSTKRSRLGGKEWRLDCRHVGRNIGRQWERTGKRVCQTQSITISSILRETRIQIVLAAAHKNSLGPNFVHFFLRRFITLNLSVLPLCISTSRTTLDVIFFAALLQRRLERVRLHHGGGEHHRRDRDCWSRIPSTFPSGKTDQAAQTFC